MLFENALPKGLGTVKHPASETTLFSTLQSVKMEGKSLGLGNLSCESSFTVNHFILIEMPPEIKVLAKSELRVRTQKWLTLLYPPPLYRPMVLNLRDLDL